MQVVNTSQEAALVKLAEEYGLQDTLEILNSSSVAELKAINSWLIQLEQYQEQEARNSEPDYSEGEENPDFPTLSDLASSEEDSSDDEEECSPRSESPLSEDSDLDQEYVNRERTCGALWERCSELYLDDSLSLEQ
jgi:hypothetical protein